jgi:hypothetical protein
MDKTAETLALLGAGAVLALALYWALSRTGASVPQAIGAGAVAAVDGVVSGAVIGAGEIIGVPATNETECDRAIREGRTWDASFSCPAGRFLGHIFS